MARLVASGLVMARRPVAFTTALARRFVPRPLLRPARGAGGSFVAAGLDHAAVARPLTLAIPVASAATISPLGPIAPLGASTLGSGLGASGDRRCRDIGRRLQIVDTVAVLVATRAALVAPATFAASATPRLGTAAASATAATPAAVAGIGIEFHRVEAGHLGARDRLADQLFDRLDQAAVFR